MVGRPLLTDSVLLAHRVTPQVPQNMQDDLQRMELEAREEPKTTTGDSKARHARDPSLSTFIGQSQEGSQPQQQQSQQPPQRPPKQPHQPQQPPVASQPQTYGGKITNTTSAAAPPQSPTEPGGIRAYTGIMDLPDNAGSLGPSFSPFPKVKGDTIPPSDEEKEDILWKARKHVLGSQNVSMQITWARDVLNWVEIVSEAAARENRDNPRPSTPRTEHELRVDALNIITYLAEQEHPQALYIRSKWIEFGKFGNRIDRREAYNGYRRAAELGHARSEYRIGMLFEQSNDTSKAKEHYYRGMAQQDSASLYRLGMMSLLGQLGEAKDYQTGLDRIRAAADNADEDSPQGAFVYGMLIGRELPDIYIPDSMLPNSPQTSMMYIEKAAYLGFAKAQHKMGQAYELCQLGCEFNPSYSIHYYGLSANQGNAEAALGVSRWFLFGYEGVFKKNEELAFKYAQQASDAKLPTGEFAMGYYHEIGIFVEKNLNEARNWYQLAADHGNKDALGRLESLNQDKTLSKQDHETTTLTRIKSQHGSQRGKRPDRFKQPQQMPTVSEGAPQTPVNDAAPGLPLPASHASPGARPTVVEHVNFPDPSRASIIDTSGIPGGDRPAFGVRVDNGSGPTRQSTAPYPEDERNLPIHGGPPKGPAPYPEDDLRGPPQGYNGGRPGPGPGPGPGPAFGIKPQGPPQGPPYGPPGGPGGPGQRPMMHGSQSMNNLHPAPGSYPDPRGRVVSAGPGAFRQNSPGPGGPHSPTGPNPQMRPNSAAPYPNQNQGRVPKQGPPMGNPSYDHRPPSAAPPPGDPRYSRQQGGHPGAGYPQPQQQDPRYQRPPNDPGRPPMGHPGASGPVPGRSGTAPPGQMQMQRPESKPSPAPSAQSAPPKPAKAATAPSKGPATFEDMGIPQGKQEGDCVSLSRLFLSESRLTFVIRL